MRASREPPVLEGKVLIDIRDLSYMTSLGITTLRKLMDDKLFPEGIKCGRARNASRRWLKSEVIAFIEAGMVACPAEEVVRGA